MSQRPLTPREKQVVALIAEGYQDKEIAAQLGLGRRTVETFVQKAFVKAGVRNRRDLAVWWSENDEVTA